MRHFKRDATLVVHLAITASSRPSAMSAQPPSVGTGTTVDPTAVSSLMMLPTPCAVASVALVGAVSVTTKVSEPSMRVSPIAFTEIVCVSTLGAKVSVPLVVL